MGGLDGIRDDMMRTKRTRELAILIHKRQNAWLCLCDGRNEWIAEDELDTPTEAEAAIENAVCNALIQAGYAG